MRRCVAGWAVPDVSKLWVFSHSRFWIEYPLRWRLYVLRNVRNGLYRHTHTTRHSSPYELHCENLTSWWLRTSGLLLYATVLSVPDVSNGHTTLLLKNMWALQPMTWFQTSAAEQTTIALFWAITQHVEVISYRRFGTTYRSYLQGSRTGFLSPEYRADGLSRKVGKKLPLLAI